MDATQLKNVKLFLSQLIELSNVVNKANPQNLDKATLKNLATTSLNIGDILVSIMSQNIDKGIIDEVGTDYSEESDTE